MRYEQRLAECPECGGEYAYTQHGRSEAHRKGCKWFNDSRPDGPNDAPTFEILEPLPAYRHTDDERALCGSPIACAVADAWADPDSQVEFGGYLHQQAANERLVAALDRLEAATRGSALRKVRP